MPVKRNKNGYLTNKFWCKICKKHLSYSFIGYPIFGFDKICKKCLNIKEKIKMSKIICDKCKNLISNELDCYNILGLWLHKNAINKLNLILINLIVNLIKNLEGDLDLKEKFETIENEIKNNEKS